MNLAETLCTLDPGYKEKNKGHQHLLCITDDLNKTILLPNTKLVAFDIHNMYPSIDNERGVEVIRNLLNSRTTLKPSTNCVIEALDICLTCNNSNCNLMVQTLEL